MKALGIVLLMTGAAAASAPEGVYDPVAYGIDGRAQGAVSMAFATGLGFATDGSASQAGTAVDMQLGVDLGVVVVDRLELGVGYRWLLPADSDDELVTTEGHRVTFGPRLYAPVSRSWAFVFALEGEATYLDLAVSLPENSGSAGAWAFGVTPTVALDGLFRSGDDIAIGVRFDVGWGFRTSHAYRAVRLRAEGQDVMPLDMGDLNLSGVEIGFSTRVAFR